MIRRFSTMGLAAAALALGACGGTTGSPDGGTLGDEDAAIDPGDAGTERDATIEIDGGPAPERPALAVACDDTPASVYAATADTSRPALEARGEIVRCAYQRFLGADELAARMTAAGVREVVPTTGAHQLLIAYRTTRRGDVAAVGSARVLVPETPREPATAMLVAAHGTSGIADACAPSRHETATDNLELPFASRGWPMIGPDYAGLGTEGVQGYGDNEDTARSTLDAARALRALLPAAALTDEIVIAGHSQGGGAVLSSQALEPTYGAGGELALVIPFAPGWQIARDATGYRFPALSTSFGGGAPAAIASVFLYAWAANTLGEERRGDLFGAAARDGVVAALDRDCIFTLATTIPAAAPTFGDLVDDGFRTGLLACADGEACTGDAAAHWAWLDENIMTPAPAGAEVLVITGTADTLATPRDVSCIVEHLRGAGVAPTVCVDGSTHFDVVGGHIGFAIEAAEGWLASGALPACPSDGALPACP